jgi:hypothetical protein
MGKTFLGKLTPSCRFAVEMLHRRGEIEKQEFRKEYSKRGMRITPTNIALERFGGSRFNDYVVESAIQIWQMKIVSLIEKCINARD